MATRASILLPNMGGEATTPSTKAPAAAAKGQALSTPRAAASGHG
jgi:hypothetical protein